MAVLLALVVTATCLRLSQEVQAQEKSPADVYAQLESLCDDIEQVRKEMGSPVDAVPDVIVSGIQPRHNFFQALSLSRRINRLCYDITGEDGFYPPSSPSYSDIQPRDVLAVVEASQRTVRHLKEHLGADTGVTTHAVEPDHTPGDVFRLLIRASRQVSLLLDAKPSPTGVFEQLTDALGTTNRLLTQFPDRAEPITPKYERFKTPADVHAQLVKCTEQLNKVLKASNLGVMEVDWNLEPAQITPNDVYQLATLIVSELKYLESLAPPILAAPTVTDLPPGRKLPSHNFQRASLLCGQMTELFSQVQTRPHWLRPSKMYR
jgi:hypothetical protein